MVLGEPSTPPSAWRGHRNGAKKMGYGPSIKRRSWGLREMRGEGEMECRLEWDENEGKWVRFGKLGFGLIKLIICN